MGVQERKAREREELRQEILDTARELFAAEGYEAVSMRKIADRIEYSPGTIYSYFRDKADLFDTLSADTLERLVERLEVIPAEEPHPIRALRAGMAAYIHFGLEHPAHYKLVFILPHAHQCSDETSKSSLLGQRAFATLVEAVRSCSQAGVLRVNNIELTSQVLWSGIHGITSLLIIHRDFKWAPQDVLIDHLLDTLLGGLKP